MGFEQLVGGFASGISQGKAAAQQRAMMEDYRKAQSDLIKIEAKKAEAQLNLQNLQAPIYQAISQAVQNSNQQGGNAPLIPTPNMPPGSPLPAGPMPMGREVAPPVSQAQPLSDMIAQGQTTGKISIPGNPANNISVRQNNPFNLKYAGQEGATGPGTNGFAIFPTPEAGVAAGIKQIQLDQGRGLTFGQFAEKYAPAYENPTWKMDVAKMIGASPETPINQIPTNLLASAIAKRESSTDISPVLGGGQQPIQNPGTRPVPITPGMGGGITAQRLLEGFLKKNFGVDPDEVKYQKMGSHLWVLDKQGRVMGVYPGQGEYKPVEVKSPDGSVMQVMQLLPPSPLPPGVPVFSPEQMTGNAGLGPKPPALMGQGIQTAPPAYSFQPVKQPTGATMMQATPQAQPGMTYQAEPTKADTTAAQGIPIADVGRANMILHAQSKLGDVNQMLLPNGEVNRGLVFKAAVPGGGIGEGSTLYSRMYQAVDSALRLETGAQANEDEIKVKMREYWPSAKDTDEVIKKKIGDLNEYINRTTALYDPTGQLTARGKAATSSGQSNNLPAGAKPTGRTSGGKPVYQLPSGQLWVQ